MRANPDKTLKVKWNRTDLENTPHLKYLAVTLDRTLSYKQHIHSTKMKVATRNNFLRKLSSYKWGTNASTIKTTELALSYSVAEYAVPVWARSAHAYKLDSELNSACRATLFGHAGHADPLDGWRCSSQKRVMSRPIQVRQLQTNESGFAISAINKYMLESRYP